MNYSVFIKFKLGGHRPHKYIDGTPNTSLSPLAAAPPEEDVGRFVLSVGLLLGADDGPGGPTGGRQQQEGQDDQQTHHTV